MAVAAAEDEQDEVWLFYVTQRCLRTSSVVTGYWLERQQPVCSTSLSTPRHTYVPWQADIGDTLARNTVLTIIPLGQLEVQPIAPTNSDPGPRVSLITVPPDCWQCLQSIHVSERDGDASQPGFQPRKQTPLLMSDLDESVREGLKLAVEACRPWANKVCLHFFEYIHTVPSFYSLSSDS